VNKSVGHIPTMRYPYVGASGPTDTDLSKHVAVL